MQFVMVLKNFNFLLLFTLSGNLVSETICYSCFSNLDRKQMISYNYPQFPSVSQRCRPRAQSKRFPLIVVRLVELKQTPPTNISLRSTDASLFIGDGGDGVSASDPTAGSFSTAG